MRKKYNSNLDGMLRDLMRQARAKGIALPVNMTCEEFYVYESRNLGFSTREEDIESLMDDLTQTYGKAT